MTRTDAFVAKTENLKNRLDQAKMDERQFRAVAADCQDDSVRHEAGNRVRLAVAAQIELRRMIYRLESAA